MALSLCGCYEAFTPDIDTTPVLCLNSLITAGEPIEVSVTRTKLYTDESTDLTVDDAIVAIYANGELCDDAYLPREGDRIHIVAESREYGRAEAEVMVPVAVEAESFEWTASLTDVYTGNAELPAYSASVEFNISATLKIPDPAGHENFYGISYYGYNRSAPEGSGDELFSPYPPATYFDMGTFQYSAEPIFSEHIGIFESVMGSDASGFTFFTDRQFSGKTYPLHLIFSSCRWMADSEHWLSEYFECGFEFTLHSVSQSFYNWSNYLWQRDNGTLEDLGNLGLGDSIRGFSNVSTGAGVVAAQSYRSYTIDLTDFIKEAVGEK